jgi:predicted Zn-dependent protease with MMP-like domain
MAPTRPTHDPGELDSGLDRFYDLLDQGDPRSARREFKRLSRRFAGHPDLPECEADLLVAEDRHDEALRVLDCELEREPQKYTTVVRRCDTLFAMSEFVQSLRAIDDCLRMPTVPDDDVERAALHSLRASCLDRLSKAEEADAEFRKAAKLAPKDFPAPPRLSPDRFDAIVAGALDGIPLEFAPYLRQVAVVVRDYPSSEEWDPFLLGLYVGVPLTERGHEQRDDPGQVFLFKRNLEIEFPDLETLRVEIRKTVIHEVAHHFGLGEDDMGEYA